MIRITSQNKTWAELAVRTLTRAFHDYTLLTYYFPDAVKRARIARYFLSSSLCIGMKYGEVYVPSPQMEGVAVWLPPGCYPLSAWRMLRAIPLGVFLGLGRRGGGKLRPVGDYIDEAHRRLAPPRHWFLHTIGVDPLYQGQGHASSLIRPMMERLDKERLPCYLETLDEKNANIYERFGFKLVEKSAIPGTGLFNWAMLRQAA